jgi:hypothetical protein
MDRVEYAQCVTGITIILCDDVSQRHTVDWWISFFNKANIYDISEIMLNLQSNIHTQPYPKFLSNITCLMGPIYIGRELDRFLFLFLSLNVVSIRIDRVDGIGCSFQHFRLNNHLQICS